jgi:hypothetical protein
VKVLLDKRQKAISGHTQRKSPALIRHRGLMNGDRGARCYGGEEEEWDESNRGYTKHVTNSIMLIHTYLHSPALTEIGVKLNCRVSEQLSVNKKNRKEVWIRV